MKKQLIILGTFLLLVIASSCNKDDNSPTDDIIGKWKHYKTIVLDEEIEFDTGPYIEFISDGTVQISDESYKAVWSRIDESSVKVEHDGRRGTEIFVKEGSYYYTIFDEDTEDQIIYYYKRF